MFMRRYVLGNCLSLLSMYTRLNMWYFLGTLLTFYFYFWVRGISFRECRRLDPHGTATSCFSFILESFFSFSGARWRHAQSSSGLGWVLEFLWVELSSNWQQWIFCVPAGKIIHTVRLLFYNPPFACTHLHHLYFHIFFFIFFWYKCNNIFRA